MDPYLFSITIFLPIILLLNFGVCYLILILSLQSYEEWSINDVRLWMEACNIDIYHELFAKKNVTGADLKNLNNDSLEVHIIMIMYHVFVCGWWAREAAHPAVKSMNMPTMHCIVVELVRLMCHTFIF